MESTARLVETGGPLYPIADCLVGTENSPRAAPGAGPECGLPTAWYSVIINNRNHAAEQSTLEFIRKPVEIGPERGLPEF